MGSGSTSPSFSPLWLIVGWRLSANSWDFTQHSFSPPSPSIQTHLPEHRHAFCNSRSRLVNLFWRWRTPVSLSPAAFQCFEHNKCSTQIHKQNGIAKRLLKSSCLNKHSGMCRFHPGIIEDDNVRPHVKEKERLKQEVWLLELYPPLLNFQTKRGPLLAISWSFIGLYCTH